MPKKTKENKKNKSNTENTNKNTEKFSFDEEIVIGLTRIDEPKKNDRNQKNKQQKNGKSKVTKSKNIKNEHTEEKIEKKSKKNKKKTKKIENKRKTKKLTKEQERALQKRRIVLKIVKYITLILIIIGGIIYTMLSPIFNIHTINIQGNSKIPSETILSLSGLKLEENIFKFKTNEVKSKIKENAYIEEVEVERKLPNEVEITISERQATYKINYGNAYAYINNQGYILEITSVKGTMPLLTGYKTSQEEIKEGNRLCTEDLNKLEDVLKIMEAATSVDDNLKNMIKEIDISDKHNYKLELTTEKKTVNLGDTTDLSTKMLWIKEFVEREKEIEGTIILNIDLNNDMPYFNEKV